MRRLVTLVVFVIAALVAIDAYQDDSASALPAGLVAAYSFSEGSGTTTVDHSGLNNPGTLVNGPTWTTAGKYGNAITFDGVNDLVSIADSTSLDLTNGMTLSAWVKPTTLTGYSSVILKAKPGNLSYSLYANTSGNKPSGEITNPSNKEVLGNSKVTLNAWTYLSATYNGSQLRIYVNGSLIKTTNTSGNIGISGNVLTIGGNNIWSNEFFKGVIDEVRIYNRALSASEITSDMNTALVDSTPPTVSVTGPSGTITGTVSITATASDASGIAGVQFLVDNVPVGAEDTTSPYSVSWDSSTVANGSHALTARARDTAGNLATSAVVTRTVSNAGDTTLPEVSITAPTPATPLSGTVSITASATDNVGVVGVTFLINGTAAGTEDTVAPYAYSWNTTTVTNGSYALSARARDAAGNQTTSAAVNVTVQNDPTPPTVSVTAPIANAMVSGNVSLTANADDNIGVAGVTFLVDNVVVGSEDTSSPYGVTWNTTGLTNGTHTITARARDAANNLTTSAPVTVTVANDTTPPTIALTAPPSTPALTGTVTVMANASDNVAVAGVQFLLNGSPLGAEDTTAPYAIDWNTTTVTNGAYNLSARARDAANNLTTSAVVAVTVSNGDTTLPTVALTAPPSTPALSGTVAVTASASDNVSVTGVQFLLNGNALGAEDTTAPYAIDWDTTTVTNGAYNLSARARDAANNQQTSAVVAVTVTNSGDTQIPTVSVTAPAGGANVSGLVAIEATATDDIGIVGVQFKLDNVNLGAEDLTAPYATTWDATGLPQGSHTITAVARDASGKSKTSDPITVTIADPNGADQIGSWSPIINLPMVAVHTALMANGNILVWDAWESGTTTARVWNPTTNQVSDAFIASQIFCAAQSYLPNGKILVTGGHDGGGTGIVDASIFDPATNQWTRLADMQLPRWYPASVELGDGRVVVIGGEIGAGLYADYPEVYNPYTNTWQSLAANTSSMHDPEYPLGFLLPDNRVFTIATSPGTAHILDVANQTWTNLGSVTKRGSAAMYAPGKIIYTGGGTQGWNAETGARVIDFNSPAPTWRTVPSMHYPRATHNLTMLPDGTLMAIGGSTIVDNISQTGSKTPELWNPVTETWKDLAPQQQNRMYHSTSLLLPDGRVLSAGGGRWSTNVNYLSAEIYSPPYLFKGARPTISNGPATANHGGSVTITTPNAADIAKVTLIGMPSVTHTMDMNQRYVELNFTKNAGSLSVQMPTRSTDAPPGPYMLFILNSAGVPSVAHMISMNASNETVAPTVAITTPAGGATLSGVINLSATASDNTGIASVEFFAGTTSIGLATTANPYTLAWNSTTVPNGAVSLTALATDVFGNTKTSAAVNITLNNATTPPPAGLVMALGFNEGTGATAADSSGTGNNGTITQAAWTAAGKYGQALSFDGINDWVTVADSSSLDLTTGVTLSAWIKPKTLSNWNTVMMKERPGHLAYALYANAGSAPSAEAWTNTGYTLNGTSGLPLGTWSHLAMSYDGTTMKLYVNGNLVAQRIAGNNLIISGSPFHIGGNSVWGDEFFSGLIDEVRVYNRALTQTELQTVMNLPVQ